MDPNPPVGILTEFGSTDTDVGDLNTSATGTAVGTYDDVRFTDAVGDHPSAGATSTVTTTFAQNTDSASEASIVRPLEWVTSTGVKELGLNVQTLVGVPSGDEIMLFKSCVFLSS